MKIQNDAIGVMPTDTIYGLIGRAFSPKAVERIYEIKNREQDKPFIILISQLADLDRFDIQLSEIDIKILSEIWPNQVSVVLPCLKNELAYLHRQTNSLAFRWPAKKELQDFIVVNGPIVAPSANPSGLPPAKNIEEAKAYFGDSIDFYIDGGILESEPSTLIALKDGAIDILRQGSVNI